MSHGPKRIHYADSTLLVETCAKLWHPDGPCEHCDDYLLEAWERMTTGGVEVPYLRDAIGRGIVRVGGESRFF